MANSEGGPLTLEAALFLTGPLRALAWLVIASLNDIHGMGSLSLATWKGMRFLLSLHTQWNITSNTSGFASYSAIIPYLFWLLCGRFSVWKKCLLFNYIFTTLYCYIGKLLIFVICIFLYCCIFLPSLVPPSLFFSLFPSFYSFLFFFSFLEYFFELAYRLIFSQANSSWGTGRRLCELVCVTDVPRKENSLYKLT